MDTEGTENILEEKEFKDLRQRTLGQAITSNMSSIITTVLCMSVYFIFMTDLSAPTFKEIGSLSITSVLIWLVNNMVFRTQFEAGEEKGRQNQNYKDIKAEYVRVRKEIENTKNGASQLEDFCEKLNEDRLISLKKAILFGAVEYPFYERLCTLSKKQLKLWRETYDTDKDSRGSEVLTKSQIKAILKANKAKVVKISSSQLLSSGNTTSAGSLLPKRTAEERKKQSKNKKGLTSFITCFFIGLIVIKPDIHITWHLIISATLKVLPILWGAYNGRLSGHDNIIIYDTEYLERETNILKQFLKLQSL